MPCQSATLQDQGGNDKPSRRSWIASNALDTLTLDYMRELYSQSPTAQPSGVPHHCRNSYLLSHGPAAASGIITPRALDRREVMTDSASVQKWTSLRAACSMTAGSCSGAA